MEVPHVVVEGLERDEGEGVAVGAVEVGGGLHAEAHGLRHLLVASAKPNEREPKEVAETSAMMRVRLREQALRSQWASSEPHTICAVQ